MSQERLGGEGEDGLRRIAEKSEVSRKGEPL